MSGSLLPSPIASAALGYSAIEDQLASAVSIEDFGASPDNRPIANTEAINAAITAVEGGSHLRGVRVPVGTYPVCGPIIFQRGNVALFMEGAVLKGSGKGSGSSHVPGVRIVTSNNARNVRIIGGHLIETSGSRSSYLFDIRGRDISVDGTCFEKAPHAFRSYMGYIRGNTSRVSFDRFRFKGGNGVYIEGRDHRFTNFDMEAPPPPGGDDSFALKAIAGITNNIRIGPGTTRNYAAVISIGSEVGRLRSDDAAYSRAVRNVVVRDVVAEDCSHVALIKPGGISVYDYRDGLVEDVLIQNVTLTDLTGAKFQRGVAITASRGAQVRRISVRNVSITARAHAAHTVPTVGAVDCYIIDYPGDPATISDIDAQVRYTDPYAGAPNGPGRPGHPVQYIARAALQRPGKGRMARIAFDIEGNGSKELGFLIGAGLDDAVEVRRAVLRNVSVSPSSTLARGGIFSRSRLRLGNLDVIPRNGKPLTGPVFR
jgi:hypothetical protein